MRITPSPDKGRAGEGFANSDECVSAGQEFADSDSSAELFNSRGTFLPYNKKLTELARQNRKSPTPAESRIWNRVLRNKQFEHYKFIRQKPIGGFIVDFYSSELKLVIEIDGESHANQAEYDKLRTLHLNSLGLRVVRFANRDVMENLDGVFIQLQGLLE